MFVSTAEAGGLAALIFFIAVLVYSFKKVGQVRRTVDGTKEEWIPWLLGATLFAHTVAFWGVNYFDQIRILWFALLAMISACSVAVGKAKSDVAPQESAAHYLAESPWRPVVRHPTSS